MELTALEKLEAFIEVLIGGYERVELACIHEGITHKTKEEHDKEFEGRREEAHTLLYEARTEKK